MTDQDTTVARLSPDSLDQYFSAGIPSTHVLASAPRCDLIIDPGAQTYELLTPVVGAEPDLLGMKRVAVDQVSMEDGPWFRLRLDCREMRHETYGVVVSVVQAMRGGASFAAAAEAAVGNLRTLLESRRRLTHDKEIGLIGELLVLRSLLRSFDEADVVEWWLGPLAEQHDLATPDYDVEVKTTTSERRTHVIHGTGQLEPNPGRPLWLLSIQLTRAGGADGLSLPALIHEVRGLLPAHSGRFLENLVTQGWRDDDAELYRARYIPRSTPAAYLVDDDFPAITTARVSRAVPHHELVSDVSYRVDVTNRDSGMPGGPLDHFLNDEDANDD
ncbi:PD-(D/E)XK motif protein [Actinotalea sp. Marseille-Q4924]|uniref:PD-(D/E)XK motif protein n=1 Tax=Actinotalea sp. Marseille-Q4924 TaxID=2866571 RepID=UPI001CE44C1B|nr:PD-(D/E)XK motif protein [Actinotalea sp. Marseille-Q4924]